MTLSYDDTERLHLQTLPTGQRTYTYDAEGRQKTISAPGGVTVTSDYDEAGQLQSSIWTGPVSSSVLRSYDSAGRMQSLTVADGPPLLFTYNNDGLLTTAGALTLQRHPQTGQITGTTLETISDERTYNAADELLTYQARASGTVLLATEYTRDQVGRITQQTETLEGVTSTYQYTYDEAGRLTAVQQNGATVATYTYDANSNRLAHTTPTGTVLGTYDEQDRLLTYGSTAYTYTANGELQSKTVNGQTTQYTYDVLGNLLRVDLPDGTTIEYIVDGEDRRIGKKVNGVLVQGFLYQDQLEPVAEVDGNGTVVSRFAYCGCGNGNVPEYMVKGGVTYRIISDHLGSPRLVIDTGTNMIVQRMDYDEFGNVLLDTNPGFQPFGFAGGIYDRHTGLTRFGARDYDPGTGRWTAKDPIRFEGDGTNLYEYVLNDPINETDPEGLVTSINLIGSFSVATVLRSTALPTFLARTLTPAFQSRVFLLISGSQFLSRSSSTLQLSRLGGLQAAQSFFRVLASGGRIRTIPNPRGLVQVVEFPGKFTATLRSFSSGVSRATIDIRLVGRKQAIKVRFTE